MRQFCQALTVYVWHLIRKILQIFIQKRLWFIESSESIILYGNVYMYFARVTETRSRVFQGVHCTDLFPYKKKSRPGIWIAKIKQMVRNLEIINEPWNSYKKEKKSLNLPKLRQVDLELHSGTNKRPWSSNEVLLKCSKFYCVNTGGPEISLRQHKWHGIALK